MLNFSISNAMMNEVGADTEGAIIEKYFLFYFDSENQNRNKENEALELKSNLLSISEKYGITKIHVRYEFDTPSEYGVFFSSKVQPKIGHTFTVTASANGVNICENPQKFEDFI
ncbi:hypothetical protein [Pseudomonas syringae group genomosp. 3]|uniref:hypothetical protein n=1 Tax=Pseudomonas syringae group genomosp. 3 TaxID=251701 RepID=UPI000EFFDB2F|nr:hypothetical protein [Pseudomonas syringae group genomosp. 3]